MAGAESSGGVHLHGGETGLDLGGYLLAELGGFVAADPGVDPDAVAHGAAQQGVHGGAVGLPCDVPQRLVEAGDGAGEDRAAPVEAALGHDLPVVLDAQRVLADQEFGQDVDGGPDDFGAPFDNRFAPADHALVGLDAAEQPAGWDEEGLDTGDLH